MPAWLRFRTAGRSFGLPLDAVAEVTAGGVPRLIPFVPRASGGILNVRGEPLPVVDAGALLLGAPAGARGHVVALLRDGTRLGVLVDFAARIESGAADAEMVDPDALFERALQLLTPGGMPGIQGGNSCPTAS
jgi:chemotaxis signal transduction protein